MNHDRQDEAGRLEALRSFDVLNTEPEQAFDDITRFAASVCDAPMAVITLVDETRQWFKSAVGLNVRQTARSIAFCNRTIQQEMPMIVADAAADPKFHDNPLVTGDPHLRFYAGFPLRSREGYGLGALAVLDRVPRTLDARQMQTMQILAGQVMALLELRRQRRDLGQLLEERDRMNDVLRNQAHSLQDAQRIAGMGGWELDAGSRKLRCSEELYSLLDLPPRAAEDLPSLLRLVPPSDRRRVAAAIDCALQGAALDIEHRIRLPDGSQRSVRQRAEMRVRDGGHRVLVGTMQDITEQHASQGTLRLLHDCISRIKDAIMITEASELAEPGPRILFVNEAFERITGYAAAEVIGRSPRMLQGPKTDRQQLRRIGEALDHCEPVTAELLNYARDGSTFWVECTISPVTDQSGAISYFVAVQRDITERKRAEAEIERLAFYDSLTALPNRRLLMDRLQQSLEAARRSGMVGALIFLDVDNFKTLNDTLGHDKGDLLLQQIARRIESCVRRCNTVARLGGDEFVILLEDLGRDAETGAAHAEVVIEKILEAFRADFVLGADRYHCTPSMGVALFDREHGDVDDLFKRADLAMYQAKAAGRNTACFFDPAMQSAINARVALEREIREALARGEFLLYYQPQTDSAGNTIGMEALVRWRHPQRGLVSPDYFIRLAEETGLILPLGLWVLESACRQLREWGGQRGGGNWPVSVNVSASQFRHPQFVELVLKVVRDSGIDPRRLKLELTESVLVENPEETIAKMARLREAGVGFSLDDFGTGYSSLSYLKRLPLDQIKIDRSFVRDVLTDPNDAAIARTILALGQILGLQVVAEGVESGAQRDFLESLGCHAYQGYFFSHPMPPERM
ncbi:EAL domain-containing protein [Noviherbaspirillum pedocola]|uniref:EAL domain-containing protein n=1 Tax=Noviherbaspirillum pedocola TaxID=2801341 RepID=A0A934SYC1_9BURK|nr:EAL domain-containing protein [Noviherbaspirillum pedocola]MBK4733988.1 EAL domain-containing protein [Noviherbaspirillum pedocola]